MRALAPAFIAAVMALPSVAAAQTRTLKFPEPLAPAPRVVMEKSPSDVYYRLPRPGGIGTFRFGIGTQVRVPDGEQEGVAYFALDVLVGAAFRFTRTSRAGVWIEGGYSYVSSSEHLASLGLGPILYKFGPSVFDREGKRGDVSIAIVPRALVGVIEGGLALGARTSCVLSFHAFGFDLGHQYALVRDRGIHEIHIAFTSIAFLDGEGD
jgi:hypothetical protein